RDVADDGDGAVCHGVPSGLPGLGRGLPEQAAAGGLVVGQADELVADDVVREPELVLETREVRATDELDDEVVALGLLVDLVGEAALAPAVRLADLAALGRDLLLHPPDDGLDVVLLEIAVGDDHEFVRSHQRVLTSLWTRPAGRGPGPSGAGRRLDRARLPAALHRGGIGRAAPMGDMVPVGCGTGTCHTPPHAPPGGQPTT